MPRTVLGTDKIICPICNHYHNNIQEYIPELDDTKGKFDMECEDCGQEFNVEYKTEVSTRTRKK